MAIETGPWDVTELLETPEDMAAYLEAAMEENDPAFFRRAIGDVVRAIGMTAVARETGLSREALYKALGENGNPTIATLSKVLAALGLRLSVAPIEVAA
ncbi:addiction module antidote protein [Novosphingobium album (ex Liu et al. 2023)]|uniref:Addiction module antidote protein n=1 Tax=Novosphingobium album (ex Liu et al. 2023) TaxID=3031130 RepID=A0ABT5WP64_9SPHN|nr:addiction module antidote protein [Novosphingobium album (ex Liu et al. 2023)]MDE8651832.1 putative addiction module antidote protein [Novosphingobium album (ex Liu et al. 2023)]